MLVKTLIKSYTFNDNERVDCYLFEKNIVGNVDKKINDYLKKIKNRETSTNYYDDDTIELTLITLHVLTGVSLEEITLLNILDVLTKKTRKLIIKLYDNNKIILDDTELRIINDDKIKQNYVIRRLIQYPIHLTRMNPYKLLFFIYIISNKKYDYNGFNKWINKKFVSKSEKWKLPYEHWLVLQNENLWEKNNNQPIILSTRKRKKPLKFNDDDDDDKKEPEKQKRRLNINRDNVLKIIKNKWMNKKQIMKQLNYNKSSSQSSQLSRLLSSLYTTGKIQRKGKKRKFEYKLINI
jgi:hypothetical protein